MNPNTFSRTSTVLSALFCTARTPILIARVISDTRRRTVDTVGFVKLLPRISRWGCRVVRIQVSKESKLKQYSIARPFYSFISSICEQDPTAKLQKWIALLLTRRSLPFRILTPFLPKVHHEIPMRKDRLYDADSVSHVSIAFYYCLISFFLRLWFSGIGFL